MTLEGNIIDMHHVVVIYVCTLVGVLFSTELFSETSIPQKQKTKQIQNDQHVINIEDFCLGFSNFFSHIKYD